MKLKQNSFVSAKTAAKRLSFLVYHSRYPLFMQNCCLWCCQSNFSEQTWRSYGFEFR